MFLEDTISEVPPTALKASESLVGGGEKSEELRSKNDSVSDTSFDYLGLFRSKATTQLQILVDTCIADLASVLYG